MSRKRLRGAEGEYDLEPRPKRAKPLLWKIPEALNQQLELCPILFNALRKCKDSENKNLTDQFMRAPSRRLYPTYYEVVDRPMDLMKIQQKVKTEVYDSISSFLGDVQLILDNTRLFFQPLSTEYQQATALELAFLQTLKEYGFVSESDSNSVQFPTELTLRIPKSHLQSTPTTSTAVPAPTSAGSSHKVPSLKTPSSSLKQEGKAASAKSAAVRLAFAGSKLTTSKTWNHDYLASNDPLKMLIAAVHNHHDPTTGDFIAEPFHQLPSRSQYPEYYRVIVQPIDLLTIRNNVEAGKYKNLKEIQEDMIIMVKNAHHFNVPGSEIFKKASILRKFFILRCSELEKKFQTVSAVALKSPIEAGSGIGAGEKKMPKLKISFSEKDKGTRSSVSSLSDLEEDVLSSSEEENSSDEEKGDEEEDEGEEDEEEGDEGGGGGGGGEKLVLYIQKDVLGSSRPHACVDPVARLLRSRKPPSLKKRLLAIYQSVVNKTDANGRVLSDLFMRRPSAKLYPEYYRVIKEPIDLREILERVRRRSMSNLQEMSQAVELMVSNATTFNEENSQVYSDALVLRKVSQMAIARIQKAWPHMPSEVDSNLPVTTAVQHQTGRGRPRKVMSTHHHPHTPPDVVTIFTTVKGHTDSRGRYLWHTFKQLPTGEPSDYYFTVKKPIDMNIIQNKMTSGVYLNLDQIMDDLTLLMDNALTFFPRQSQESMDAVALQRIIISKYTQLKAMSGESSEDVRACVQKILSDIISGTLNSVDSADCLIGVKATKKVKVQMEAVTKEEEGVAKSEKQFPGSEDGVTSHSFNFENIKAWLAAGEYRRLDQLQSDFCDVLRQASKHWQGGGIVNLGRQFMVSRNKLCGEATGQLWSPALSYTVSELVCDLDAAATSHSKSPSPMSVSSPTTSESDLYSLSGTIPGEDCGEGVAGVEWAVPGTKCDECARCVWEGEEYQAGDVLYVKSSDTKPRKPHIVRVEKFWTDQNNSECFDGTWFYRPEETFHVARKKFYKKELFRSDFHGVAHMSQVMGRASILFLKDFPKFYPKGYSADDVFVCESRYSYRTKQFKKIKSWIWPGVAPTLLMRNKPLSMTRFPSIFVSGTAEEEEEKGPLDTPFVQTSLASVMLSMSPPFKYYEQYCIDDDCFRTGDFVYLRSDQENPFIARVERMWTDDNGDPWIHGPWFLRPREVEHAPTRTFYHQELLLSNIQDTNPMRSISGRCLVLFYNDYCKKRPTEYAESDVYVCLSRYNEVDKEIKRVKGWKTFQHSDATRKDEVYHFTTDLQLTKVASPKLFTKEFNPVEEPIQLPHVKATATATPSPSGAEETPIILGGGKTPKGISITPQFLQQLLATASKMSALRPVVSSGQSSVQLTSATSSSSTTTTTSTQLAQALMSSSSAAAKLEVVAQVPPNKHQTEPAAPALPAQKQQQTQQQQQQQQLFRCYWESCSIVFTIPLDLYSHVVGPGPSHISKEVEGSYFCRWKNCPRSPSNVGGRPFDTINKIIRHMKEVHLMKLSSLFGIGVRAGGIPRVPATAAAAAAPVTSVSTPPIINPLPNIGRPLPPKTTPSIIKPLVFSSSALPTSTTPAKTAPTTTSVADIFIPPPENRQSLVHSDIYLRYIQGMKTNSSHLSSSTVDSETLRSTNQTDIVSLPKAEEWFSADAIKTLEGGEGATPAGQQEALMDALWALRDHMNEESLKLSNYLDTNP